MTGVQTCALPIYLRKTEHCRLCSRRLPQESCCQNKRPATDLAPTPPTILPLKFQNHKTNRPPIRYTPATRSRIASGCHVPLFPDAFSRNLSCLGSNPLTLCDQFPKKRLWSPQFPMTWSIVTKRPHSPKEIRSAFCMSSDQTLIFLLNTTHMLRKSTSVLGRTLTSWSTMPC